MSVSTFIRYSLLLLVFATATAQAQLQGVQQRLGSVVSGSSRSSAAADEEEEETPPEPQYLIKKDNGLSLGIDLSPFVMRIINNETTGFAAVARYGLVSRWWAAAEAGFDHSVFNSDNFAYKSNGTFIRLGIDYDIFNNEKFPTNDNIFVGLRYAYAWQSHESESYRVVDSYWGDFTGSVPHSSVNSHSLDALFGLRCEVLPHFYMGWSFRCRFLLYSAYDESLTPYTIAGYGRFDSKLNMGFTYSLEYQLPTVRKK